MLPFANYQIDAGQNFPLAVTGGEDAITSIVGLDDGAGDRQSYPHAPRLPQSIRLRQLDR
jgi:hypothetical protein